MPPTPTTARSIQTRKEIRPEPRLKLPEDFFGYYYSEGKIYNGLKPFDALTDQQKEQVTKGPYRCLPIHPTQLYSSADAFLMSLILYVFWRRSKKAEAAKQFPLLTKPGSIFALMLILYSIERFFTEFLRDDNPFEYAWWMLYKGGTISQNLAIYMFIFGIFSDDCYSRKQNPNPCLQPLRSVL